MKNLYLRNSTFYYRKNIPKYLKILFNNRALYIRSLSTKSKTLSIKYVKLLNRKFEHIKESYLIGLDTNLIKQLINDFHNTQLELTEDDLYNISNPEDTLFGLGLDDNIKSLQLAYEKEDFTSIYDDLDGILQKLPKSPSSEEMTYIGKQFLNVQIDNLKKIRDKINNGDYKKPRPSFISQTVYQNEQKTPSANKTIETKKIEPKLTIRDTYKDFIKYQAKEDEWSKDTYQLANRTAIILDMYFKDIDIKDISYMKLYDFKDLLFELPASFMNKSLFWNVEGFLKLKSDYKNIYYDSIKDFDFIRDNSEDMDKLSNKTIRDYVIKVNQYFRYLNKFELIVKYNDLSLPNVKLNSGRENYTDEEVIKIRELLRKDSKENYFITLLAMFQGMRTKEITQLTKDDIKTIDGIKCIYINANEDKTTKNDNSIRYVPIHNEVLNDGFIEYINTKKKNLFNINNKDFSTYFRKKYKNVINENKTFYSLRHSYITKLVGEFDNYEHLAMIVGHASQFEITFGVYNHKIPVKKLQPMVNFINYNL